MKTVLSLQSQLEFHRSSDSQKGGNMEPNMDHFEVQNPHYTHFETIEWSFGHIFWCIEFRSQKTSTAQITWWTVGNLPRTAVRRGGNQAKQQPPTGSSIRQYPKLACRLRILLNRASCRRPLLRLDGLRLLSRKASTPCRPYPTLLRSYMSDPGRLREYPQTCRIYVLHKVILTYGWWPNLVNTRRAGFEDGKPRILKESIENQQS